jgi:asparagine synthase (glutamine-hydrolysing)
MCGISGVISFNKTGEAVKSLPNILDEIKHRGPDDEGCVFFSDKDTLSTFGKDTPENVKSSSIPYAPKSDSSALDGSHHIGLGHRRLSILDLSEKGHQPLCDETENYWIVYNGEVYNYQEIRKELIENGHQFTTETDTEVVLKSYLEWGKACLHKFNGMWSFVIYNKATQQLFGARDRFGVKPFYYIHNTKTFAFCSEIKGLLKLADFRKEINPTAVYDYLIMSKMEIDAETFFKNIFELKPGHSFELDTNSGKLAIEKYYTLKYNKNWKLLNQKEFSTTISSLKRTLTKAISIRLNADVKTGSCLSGGIDSSVVVTNINELLSQKEIQQIGTEQEVFTASYPNTKIDESGWAKLVVDQTKTNWNQTFPTAKDLQNQIEALVYAQDIPFGSPTSFTQFKVMELIQKKEVKVSIDGQGADELFGGYSPHFTAAIFNALKSFSLKSLKGNLKTPNGSFSNHSQVYKLPIQYFIAQYFPTAYFNRLKKRQPELSFLNATFVHKNKARFRLINDQFSSSLNGLLHFQFTNYGLKQLLRTADRSSMHFSVESRMPFVDDTQLVETVFNISGANKIKNGISKTLLREAMKDVLPKEIYNRTDKLGFATPQSDWFKDLKPYFKEILETQKTDEFVDWDALNENFEAVFNQAIKTDTKRFWRLINFALWRKVYQV